MGGSATFATSKGKTASKDSLKVTLGTITPYVGVRSSCGNQVRSTRISQPSYGFGTGTRETQNTRFISNMHVIKDNAQARHLVPGPGNYKERAITASGFGKTTGKQYSSDIRSQPAWGFGTQSKFDDRDDKRTAAVPGPGAYTPA